MGARQRHHAFTISISWKNNVKIFYCPFTGNNSLIRNMSTGGKGQAETFIRFERHTGFLHFITDRQPYFIRVLCRWQADSFQFMIKNEAEHAGKRRSKICRLYEMQMMHNCRLVIKNMSAIPKSWNCGHIKQYLQMFTSDIFHHMIHAYTIIIWRKPQNGSRVSR